MAEKKDYSTVNPAKDHEKKIEASKLAINGSI